MGLSEDFPNKSLEEQKKEMRIDIARRIKDGENVDMDMWLYENQTENGIPIEAWLQANEEEE